jgi:hypothetical protein
MDRYKAGRIVARITSVIGWLMALMSTFVLVTGLFRGSAAMVGASVPVLGLLGGSMALVLFGWVARAVFDIAAGRPPMASNNASNRTPLRGAG